MESKHVCLLHIKIFMHKSAYFERFVKKKKDLNKLSCFDYCLDWIASLYIFLECVLEKFEKKTLNSFLSERKLA